MPPAESRLAELRDLGQSAWLDHIDRSLLRRGGLQRMADRDGLGGVTTAAAGLARSVEGGNEYDETIRELARHGRSSSDILDHLSVDDVRAACDVLAPVYLASGGEDGFVSIGVSPLHARDAGRLSEEAHRLFAAVDRPNVLVGIPGTPEGLPAVLRCLRDGLNVDVTLLFSLSQYEAVADVYLESLEYRLAAGETIRSTSSVASFSLSPMDAYVDRLLEQMALETTDEEERRYVLSFRGKAAVANARVVYERFRSYLNSREWQLIAASGAKVQRLLWADTGVKNPEYPPALYADELIGEHTVSAMPERTWRAFKAHGIVARTVDRRIDEAHRLLRDLSHSGIDLERVGVQLQNEAVQGLADSFHAAVDAVERKRVALLAAGGS